jgi:hypothetical protein
MECPSLVATTNHFAHGLKNAGPRRYDRKGSPHRTALPDTDRLFLKLLLKEFRQCNWHSWK